VHFRWVSTFREGHWLNFVHLVAFIFSRQYLGNSLAAYRELLTSCSQLNVENISYISTSQCPDSIIVIEDLGEGGDAEPAQEGINKKDADKRVHIFELIIDFLLFYLFVILLTMFLSLQISPASTLESSFEALNVKKFDGMFQVFSLYASIGHIYLIIGLKS
jgi:hypothetical protein